MSRLEQAITAVETTSPWVLPCELRLSFAELELDSARRQGEGRSRTCPEHQEGDLFGGIGPQAEARPKDGSFHLGLSVERFHLERFKGLAHLIGRGIHLQSLDHHPQGLARTSSNCRPKRSNGI